MNRPAVPTGRDREAFPTLSQEQIDRATRFGSLQTMADGTRVFERGQRQADFFIVLSGCIEIFDYDCDGAAQVFTKHCDNQFTGEIDLFSDRKVLVAGRTAGETTAIRFNRQQFRELLAAEPDIAEIVLRAFIIRRLGILQQNLGGSILLGHRNDPLTLQIRRFLRGNGYPAQTIFHGDEPIADKILSKHNATADDLPMLLCHGEEVLRKPSIMQVAEAVGIVEWPTAGRCYDLAVIGGGPGGMAAAVYGASEGLSTVVLEREAPGGQASTSSKIENYLGFPNGLSGQELAGRAQIQAQKFGATLALPMQVTGVVGDKPPYEVQVEGGPPVSARSIVIASGATYRKLGLSNDSKYEGRGIHYAATAIEAGLCEGNEVVVVGGGNSAGQAAIYLSGKTKHVHLLVRRDGLSETMSDYLIRRIEASSKITLHTRTEITQLAGEPSLQQITWTNRDTGEVKTNDIKHLFLMIGAVPNSGFLNGCVLTDANGFICTGQDVIAENEWNEKRPPEPFETSLPAVFAIGDIRANSVKRVASAVGEGSICVQFVHRVIANP
ncbi:Thioredoxin reductase [Stieleria bergensis]|uniref:Thioredoxin reductase n=1 Tax=Stieleria bergensis TaxID=2528025 RepID=A0A517SWQ5_9BACT|nr:Thioredoxin reductase [Planctomycetes bacterium SV_7m_r]